MLQDGLTLLSSHSCWFSFSSVRPLILQEVSPTPGHGGRGFQEHPGAEATRPGISLEVQWLRLRAPNEGDRGLTPGQGTKIPHATTHCPACHN